MQYLQNIQHSAVGFYQTHHFGSIGCAVVAAEIGVHAGIQTAIAVKQFTVLSFHRLQAWEWDSSNKKEKKEKSKTDQSVSYASKLWKNVKHGTKKIGAFVVPKSDKEIKIETEEKALAETLKTLGSHVINFIPMAIGAVHPVAGIAIPVLFTLGALVASKMVTESDEKLLISDKYWTMKIPAKIVGYVKETSIVNGIFKQFHVNFSFLSKEQSDACALALLTVGGLMALQVAGMNPLANYKFTSITIS